MDEGQDIGTCLKEDSPGELEIDEEMEMEEVSAGEEEEEEIGDPGSSPSPEQQMALGHGSSDQGGTSGSSFPLSQDDGSTMQHKHSHFSGKPLSIRRGPGRPRKDKPSSRSSKKSIGLKLKSSVYVRGITKSPSVLKEETRDGGCGIGNPVLEDAEPPPESPSPARSVDETPSTSTTSVDPETGQGECSTTTIVKTEKVVAPEEPPYFQEQWPGKVCALCNLGERSQLGQGDLMRFSCPEGFTPHKSSPTLVERGDPVEMMSPSSETYTGDAADRESIGSGGGDKSPRGSGSGAVTVRRQKGMAKSRNPSLGGNAEQLDELSIVGFPDEPEVGSIFETSGHFYVHQSCALWSSGVTRTEDLVMENVGPAVLEASKRRCSHCNHFGATITCIVTSCTRVLHFPCAAASGAFQDCKTVTMVCNQHLDQVPLLLSGEVTCMTCFALGDVSNLMMCTNCGHHYHGSCVGLALLPGVRAGWQCPDCRVCQVCRQPEEDSKVMLCEKCDKAYHPQCLRPIVTTIPKIGWKCKCCRVCSDCGSRTPGAGLSSRWHAHYTVCDSCYQQRNKGFSCPLCKRAYRAAAHREMVQCAKCRKFVHGTCDAEADLTAYNHKKESNPGYEYICTICKPRNQPGRQMMLKRKDSAEDAGLESSLTGSQESLYATEDSNMEVDYSSSDKYSDEGSIRAVGLGKGKPFCASKIAKKKLGLSSIAGRPKGIGKVGSGVGKVVGGYQKRQRVTEFGRKRGPKAKMRGIFGVPGLGLQRPQADSSLNKSEEEPGVENRLVLCSAKDKFVLTQDICVMCGAIGIDQEGCLIACAQCGQCYHPYCVNVKVTKVILQKGWRCLDCTVCEGCGQRNDEGRLILCDDCDISYHIYCMDPPLDYVPHGNWKCKWCATCLSCGSNDPGFNCMWQKSFTECGPCASHTTCPSCLEPYNEGDLIIQCVQCERWLHCLCDQIRTETEAERCAEDGYNCVLCRPRDVPPPHLQPPQPPPKPPTPTKSPEVPKLSSQAQFYMDGVCLSEMGLHQIKALTLEQQQQSRKKRITKKIPTKADKEAGILATIESVVAGGSLELDEAKEEVKIEPVEVYKEGMVVPPREDGRPPEPPEGFTIHTTESGVMLLRRKRQRNLQKLGIGGFNARLRGTRNKEKDEEGGGDVASGAVTPTSAGPTSTSNIEGSSAPEDKPRRKAQRRKPKNKLMESYPSYLQEAFFGRDLLDTTKEKDMGSSSDSDEERASPLQVSEDKIIQLSQDELKVMEEVKAKQEKEVDKDERKVEGSESGSVSLKSPGKEEDDGSDTEGLKDILPGDLLDTDLVNTIMNEDDDITKSEDNLDDIGDAALADDSLNDSLSMPDGSADVSGTSHKDELADILSPNFNLESMVSQTGLPNMDCKDVEEIFKGVLTDESQESQESVFPLSAVGTGQSTPVHTSVPHGAGMVSPSGGVSHPALQSGLARSQVTGPLPSVGQPNLSPISFPPPSPYHSEYSNSPFSEPPSPWLSQVDVEGIGDVGTTSTPATSGNRQNTLKMEQDEAHGSGATISSVLYANVNHPEWKKEFPVWADRSKQILKKWRALPSDRKAPFLQQARENRAALRMKKAQQIPKDNTKPSVGSISPQSTPSTSGGTGAVGGPPQLAKKPANGGGTGGSVVTTVALVHQKSGAGGSGGGSVSPSSNVVEDQDKIMQQQKTCREAEQERQWKQLQAMRQQQAQQQQQTIHDQRVQAMARVHRQISADGMPFSPDQAVSPLTTQLQVSTTQDPNTMAPLASPSPGTRTQFPAPQVKVSRVHTPQSPGSTGAFPHPSLPPPPLPPPHPTGRQEMLVPTRPTTLTLPRGAPTAVVRQSIPTPEPFGATRLPFPSPSQPHSPFSPQPPQSPHSPASSVTPTTPQSATPQADPFQRTETPTTDPYAQPPHTPRPQFITSGHQSPSVAQRSPVYVSTPRPSLDPYAQSPATPRPQFSSPSARPTPQVVYAPGRVQQPQPQQSPQQQQDPYASQPPTPRPTQIDPYAQQIPTPRPQDPYASQPQTPRPQQVDPYAQQPATPRPRIEGEIFSQQQQQQGPEVNRQLRDLLQRQQQIKKLEQDQVVQGQPRLWSQQDGQPAGQDSGIHPAIQQQVQQQTAVHFENPGAAPIVQQQQAPTSPHPVTATNSDGTFRQPLPPALARPRLPSQTNVVIRSPTGVRHPLQGLDPRLQGVDPRTRLLIHQQRAIGNVQGYPAHIVHRLPGPRNPLDPYDHLVQQRQQLGFPQDGSGTQGVLAPNATVLANQRLVRQATPIEGGHANQLGVQMRLTRVTQQPGHSLDHSAPQRAAVSQTAAAPGQMTLPSPAVSSVVGISTQQTLQQCVASPSAVQQVTAVAASAADTQEIPESVTAELEKLEQEGGAMVEVEGVGAILAELGDDKELLEMGNDFNILEYADPELDTVTGGEKTNILDENLDLEEEDNSKEEHKGVKKELPEKGSSESSRPDKPAESVKSGVISSAATVIKDDASSSAPPPATTVEGEHAVAPSPVVSQPATTSQPVAQKVVTSQPQEIQQQQVQTSQQIQQPQPQQLQQTSVSPLTQQPPVGRPIVAGRMVSPDGGVTVSFQNTFPPAVSSPAVVPTGAAHLQRLPPGHLQVQQRVQMRIGPGMVPAGVREGPARVVSVVPGGPIIQHSGVGVSRMGLAPPPPPPPYPGPPPPYPGPCQQSPLQEQPLLLEDLLEQEKREQEKQQQHQPLLSQQPQPPPASTPPPLLSDVEFERLRADVLGTATSTASSPGLGSPPQGIPAQGLLPSPNLVPVGSNLRSPYPPRPAPQPQPKLIEWQPGPSSGLDSKLGPSGIIVRQQPAPGVQGEATAGRVPLFNAPHLPAPPLPPENIMTEQDRQIQLQYEQWLNHQNQVVTTQLKYYETEVSKLRKIRKSLNSKQRQLRKSGNELTEADAMELQRISSEQSILQKQLDASRKQSRQHGMLIQEYRNKQQQKQRQQQGPGTVGPPGLLIGPPGLGSNAPQQQSVVIHSPLGPPASSPVHHPSTPQSPMMSPSPSPMMQQHSSPLHSPGPLLSHSPGPGSVTSMLQHSPGPGSVTSMLQHSPGNPGPGSNSGMSPHSMQPSPRMGTPHSQSEESPFSPGTPQELLRSLPSPQQVCPPLAGRLTSPQGHGAPRMTSPQHRMGVPTPQGMGRLVTSPVSYTADHRAGQQQFSGGEQIRIHSMPPRFVRSPMGGNSDTALQRPRGLPVQGPGQPGPNNVMYSQPSSTQVMRAGVVYSSSASPSPLGSPQPIMSNVVGQPQQFQQQTQQNTAQAGQQPMPQQGQQNSGHMQQQQVGQPQQQPQQQTTVQIQQPQGQTGVPGQMIVRQVQGIQQGINQQSPQQLVQRQQLQQHLQQQQQLLQQQHQGNGQTQEQEANLLLAQRQQLQLAQQRQMIQQQQQLAQQQRQQILQQQQLVQQRQQQQQLAQQHQQMLQQQQQQQNQPSSPMTPRSPMIVQNQPPSSPMPPRSPMIHQQQQHQNSNAPPSSPMPPRSPMVQSLNQNQMPNSPMPPQSPMLQQMNQNQPPSSPMPPCSPVIQQQYQQIGQNQPPSSPVLRSPMVQNLQHSVGSPMQMRHPSSTGSVSNSPVLPDRPQSVENPLTPRTPHTPHTPYTPQSNQQGESSQQGGQGQFELQDNDGAVAAPLGGGGGGGGNPNNPANPLPLPAMFGRFGYFKLGLRGGSPMWSVGAGFGKGGRQGGSKSNDERGNGSGNRQDKDVGEGTSRAKVESRAENKSTRQSSSSVRETRCVITPGKTVAVVSKVASLVCVDYNDFDDENSHTPPLTPPSQDVVVPVPSTSSDVDYKETNTPTVIEIVSEQDLSSTEKSEEPPSENPDVQGETEREGSNNTKELMEEKCGEEIEVAVISQEDILESDTVVSSDLHVESLGVEETDCDNVVVFEHLSESDLVQVSSSIDTDIIEECIVTSSDIVMDISVVDALESCEKLTSCIQKDDDEVLHLVDEDNKAEAGDIMETTDEDDGLGGIGLSEGSDDIPNMDMDVMNILDSRVRGVLDRDPVLDMPEGCREIHSMNERLRIGMARSLGSLQQEKIVAITDTPESPDQEEMNVDPSPEPYMPTPDTIKDDEDDIMPLMHDDADMMEMDETSRTPIAELENITEIDMTAVNDQTETLEMNVTSSDETSNVVSCVDTVEDNSSETLRTVVSVATTRVSSREEVMKPDFPFGMPPATQIPPSSVHQANIGIPGTTRAVVTYPTFPGLTMPAASYARGQHHNLSSLLTAGQTTASESTATTMSVLNTVIASSVVPVTKQVTSVVPSTISVPHTMSLALDSVLTTPAGILSAKVSPAASTKEKIQLAQSILSTSHMCIPSVASAIMTHGTETRVKPDAGLVVSLANPECTSVTMSPHSSGVSTVSATTEHSEPAKPQVQQSVIGVSPTFSIIKSAIASPSTRRTSILQGSTGSSTSVSAVPVCIIRSQGGGGIGGGISTTMSIISSASTVALPVTSTQLTSATVANLVADAVNAARLPYPPASVGQQLAFTTAGVVPLSNLVTATPAGVSVIASAPRLLPASTVSLGGVSVATESLVPPPRMTTIPLACSQSVSPHVPVTVQTSSPSIQVVDTNRSSSEIQNYRTEHSPPTIIQTRVEERVVDNTSKSSIPSLPASQTAESQKESSETLDDTACKLSRVTRPSVLETMSQNLISELPPQSLGTEVSSVQVIQRPVEKIDEDDEILMKTVQLIFQDTRPSVLATVERATSVPSQTASAVQQEPADTSQISEVDSSQWQHKIPVTSSTVRSVIVSEDVSSSETQQSLAVTTSKYSTVNKEQKKESTLADKLSHSSVQDSLPSSSKVKELSKPYSVPSPSNMPTMPVAPHQSEETRMDYDDNDTSFEIPIQTNATDSQSVSLIEHSTKLKLPLEAVDSATSIQTLMDVVDAPSAIPPDTSAVFIQPPQNTITTLASNTEIKSLSETTLSSRPIGAQAQSVLSTALSGLGQSMLESRLTAITTSGPQRSMGQMNQSVASHRIIGSSEMMGKISSASVPISAVIPSVVVTSRISPSTGRFSPVVTAGQAVASAVRQYVAYAQQQAASRTSPVIASISKSSPILRSLSTPSPAHSPQLLTPSPSRSPSTPQLSAQASANVIASSSAGVISSIPRQALATEQFSQSRMETLPVQSGIQAVSTSSSVLAATLLQSQSSTVTSVPQSLGTTLHTRVSTPSSVSGLVASQQAVQQTALYGGSSRPSLGDSRVQELVVTSVSGRFGGDVMLSVSSESGANSRDSGLTSSSKSTSLGYPYASSAPPRIQSSGSVFSGVMQPQRRMSTGEIKPEEPIRSCQFEQLTTVKSETLDSCLFKEAAVPTSSFIMQQQRQSSAIVTAISKPLATSSIIVSQSPIVTLVPKTETQHPVSSCKFSSTSHSFSQPQQQAPTLSFPHRMEESQNVLLKQLLQNTGCAQTQSQQTPSVPTVSTHHHGAPSLPVVPSLEAQLARPVPPTPTSLLPPLLTNDNPQSQPPKPPQISRPSQLMTRETSFVSRPQPQLSTSPSMPAVSQQQQTPHSERKPCPPSRTPSREDLLSPPTPTTPRSCASGADSNLHTPSPLTSPLTVTIKKEVAPPQQSPVHPMPPGDVKKEIVSDDSSMPLTSEKKEFHGKVEQPSRDDISDLGMETSCDKTAQDQAALDMKKIKRRLYQQKRRQSQGKEPTSSGGTPKKQRIRKVSGSKVDEDYDTYIENLMTQLRQLPAMSVLEPALSRNYAVCSIFGSGDLTKIGMTRDYSTRQGDLKGTFGVAQIAHVSDHYNTQPFGDLPPLAPQPPVSTQRGFYDQEFAALKLENDDDKKPDAQAIANRDRDNDTPDTVISSSSPECVIPEFPVRFPGLRLIEEDDSEKEEDTRWMKRLSPIIPIISPIPIRLRPGMQIVKETSEVDKENVGVSRDHIQLKTRFGVSPPTPLRDAGNVTVTLTLTSAAAEDILGVLRNLANILSIPAPSGYQIVERTSTPPSQKLGLYRTKGKDGKEGAPIDIQSILNGAAKFCRHCDVVILSNLIRKKASELPFLAKDDLVENGDDLYFCSSTCYMQFALMHRSPSISEDKAAAIVDHLCQTTQSPSQQQKKVRPLECTDKTKEDESVKEKVKVEEEERMEVEQQEDEAEEIKMEQDVAEKDEASGPQPAPAQTKEAESITIKTEPSEDKVEKEPPSATTVAVSTSSTVVAVVATSASSTPPRVTSSEKKSRRHTGDDSANSSASHCLPPPTKVWKGLKYKYWTPGAIQPAVKYKKPTDKEITEMLFRMGITMTPAKIPDDTRKCMFCHQIGDGVADGPARLLNFDVDKWVHLNCALWSDDVYETVNGALMNLENSLQQSLVLGCAVCHRTGATIRCFKLRCSNVYHLGCALKDGCVFFKNKSTYCTAHVPKNEKDNELTTLSVFRRVYVNRDENRQVATVMHQDHNNLLRVGSLIFLSVGQLLPHQLQAFHTPNYIYPIGYKIVRFYWSMRVPNKRCRYVCSIHDVAGRPEFRVLVQEPCQDDLELRDSTPRAVWARILEPLATLRKEMGGVQVFPRYISGEDLFGLTEPAVVRVLESLPGIETLTDYRFKYGRNPLLELPLAVNPTGCARTEPKLRNQFLWKRPHTQRTGSSSRPIFVPTATVAGEAACPYSKQFVHSKSSQYKKMKQEWRNNVYLARSKIQGLGLYAARDLERHTMVIEYIGEVIRTELSEQREKLYEARNRGIYMFRLDEERVVDATLSGGLARYINHSCNPNCVAEIVEVERDLRIIIFAKRRISRGEELAYDYKFDIEDDQHKIPCNCGAPNCRKWMN